MSAEPSAADMCDASGVRASSVPSRQPLLIAVLRPVGYLSEAYAYVHLAVISNSGP